MNTCGSCYYYTVTGILRYPEGAYDVRQATYWNGCKKFDRILSANTEACPEFRWFYDVLEKPPKPEGTFRKWLKSIKIRRAK